MIQSCCCWNLTWRKKIAGTSQHAIPPSAAHLLPRGAATCCRLSRTGPGRSGPSWPRLGPFNTTQNMDRIFPSRVSSPPPPFPETFPISQVVLHLMWSNCLRKIQRLKKYFFFSFLLISCSLQRFYFVKKKGKKGTKTKVLWRNPHLRSSNLTSVLRAFKTVCFFSRDVTLCPLASLHSLSFLSQT